LNSDPEQSFEEGWPVRRADGLDDLDRFLEEPEFRTSFRLPGGQFAVSRRDDSKGLCAALRDPSASMPLHAHFDGRNWLVAPRVGALEQRVGRKFPLKFSVLKQLHQTGRIHPDQSLYEETIMLSPGVVYLFGPGRRVARQEVPIEWPDPVGVERDRWSSANEMAFDLIDSIRSAVVDSVSESPGPAVLQYSGGLDSNLILHAGTRSGLSFKAIGMTFPGMECDESEPMAASCEMLGVPLEQVDFRGLTYDDWRGELFANAEYVPFTTAFMALDLARRLDGEPGRVLLNGIGGDEIFATGPDSASAFLARLFGWKTPLLIWERHTKRTVKGVLRRSVSGLRAIDPYLRSGSAHFQLALVQLLASEGTDYRMPFCDWRVAVRVRVLNALYSVAAVDTQRSLQRAILDNFSPGASKIVGLTKPNFDAVGAAPENEPDGLGPSMFPRFHRLVPDFIAAKSKRGRVIR